MADNKSGADTLLEAAARAGIDVTFANPGTTEMWLVGALDRVKNIRPVLCLAETVATGAADGFGRMARRPAATILHLGPGLANGIANLHNARRAGSPILNIVGDMAQWHSDADPLLAMDIKSLSNTVALKTYRPSSVLQAVADLNEGLSMISGGGNCGGMSAANDGVPCGGGSSRSVGQSRVVTLILPHDVSWDASTAQLQAPGMSSDGMPESTSSPVSAGVTDSALRAFMSDCAAAMRTAGPKAAMFLGGEALLGEGLEIAGRIAAVTGAKLICENAFARIDRGAGLPSPQRLPYFPQEAARELQKYSLVVCVGTRLPVAMFGYKGGPSNLVTLDEDSVWELDAMPPAEVLQLLGAKLGIERIKPFVNCGGIFCGESRPSVPSSSQQQAGKLTAAALCQTVAAVQPPDCIIVDESLTSGGTYWEHSKGCPRFSHLTLTGGAIGSGIPMAIGAAIACPGRKVISLQADGSGMYSLQGLWTQARENLDIVTVICANSAYAILKVEMARQGVPCSRSGASQELMDLGRPRISWASLARGMGLAAVEVSTPGALKKELEAALQRSGPTAIEACLL